MSFWSALKAGFGFLSILPVGITMEGIEDLMNRLYLYPVVGALLGLLIGIGAFFSELIFPSPITAVIVILLIYGLTWFNHLDGVADIGDGMTAHGSLEKKRKALKDTTLGIGGIGFTVLLLLALYSSVLALETVSGGLIENTASPYLFGAVSWLPAHLSILNTTPILLTAFVIGITMCAAEVGGKQGMLTIATFGKSFQEGLGSMTIKGGTRRNYLIGTIFSALVLTLLWGIAGLLALLILTLAALIILKVSNRHFEGLNGDGIGMSNEICRVVVLMTLSVILFLIGGVGWML